MLCHQLSGWTPGPPQPSEASAKPSEFADFSSSSTQLCAIRSAGDSPPSFWKSLLPVVAGLCQIFWLPLVTRGLELKSWAMAQGNTGINMGLHQGEGTGSLKPLLFKHFTVPRAETLNM